MTDPRIITYTTTDPDAPPHLRAAASMLQDGPGRHWMATGATPEEAEAKIRAYLAPKPRKTRAPAEDADVGDVI